MKWIAGFRTSALALVTCAALVAFRTEPAAAQEVCGDLGDVPDEVVEFMLVEFDEDFGFPVNDESLCSALTANFVKTCTTAVKDSIKCYQDLFANHAKQRQIGCKGLESGADAKLCSARAKESAKQTADGFKSAAEDLSEDCETDEAEDFFSVCMFGF